MDTDVDTVKEEIGNAKEKIENISESYFPENESMINESMLNETTNISITGE